MAERYSDIVKQRRDEMVSTILTYIEQNPTEWQRGWQVVGNPINAVSAKAYRGMNLMYLTVVSMLRKYDDNRWVTFNQAKQLGASVKKGEKSVPVLYYSIYDENTKKDFDVKSVAGMTDEERAEYEKKYVHAYMKYYQVFNAAQCANFPAREVKSMGDAERQKQNALVESIIANSAAPVMFDGGDNAYYDIQNDDIHLPKIAQFDTMQDYYATALHEIAHSTGHASRLGRDMSGGFGSEKYALEELRAELSSVFLQMENGLTLDGKHYKNHSAYLASWLSAVKKDKTAFTSAVKDAMKISDYINEHYARANATRDNDDTKEKTDVQEQQAVQQKQALNVEHEQISESAASNTPDAKQEKIVRDVQKGKLKDWQQIDKTVSGYAETSYEYFEDVNSVAMYKHNNTDTYYIGPLEYHAKNKAVKAENFIFDKETALKEFAAVKAFKERELSARDENLKKLSREELESRIANELHNKYVGDSIQMSYAKMLLARKEQEQQAQRTVENVAQEQKQQEQQTAQPAEKKTQEISHTSWTKFELQDNQVGARYDRSTLIKLPDTEQLKGYVVFVPSKLVRKDKQGYALSLKGDMNFTIKNDGMEMKVSASELASLLQGQDVGKEPLRVAPKKINKERIEALDNNLPAELKDLKQWCAFTTFRDDNGDYKKKNIDVKTGNSKGWAKVNDSTTWADFKTAKQYALENNCAGLTIVLTPESGISCIDLDKCVDDAGNVSEFAQKVLKATEGTYAEKSVSGHGIHIFVKGDLLDNGKYKNVSGSKEQQNEIEVYNQSKFISLTGNVIGNSAQKLSNVTSAQLTSLHELMEQRPTVNTKKKTTTVRTATADEVEQRILRSKKRGDYQRLMAGESLTGDHSKDDFMLLNMLAFFSDCDANVMREIFMRSGQYRAEGGVGTKKSIGYLDTSIKNAINSLSTRPSHFSDKTQQTGVFGNRGHGSKNNGAGVGFGAGGDGAGADK